MTVDHKISVASFEKLVIAVSSRALWQLVFSSTAN